MKENARFHLFSAIDVIGCHHYIGYTSLLSVSTAGRGAVSSGAALAFFMGWPAEKGIV